MTQYNVTLHKLFNGIIPELSQRQEVEIAASDRESAGKQAVASFGGEGWVVTNIEILGGPESENVKSAAVEDTASVAGRAISHAANVIVERDARIKRLENVAKRARAKRRKVEKQNEFLQEQEENLRDWIKDDQAKLKAKQEELNQLKEMYADIHGKHSNLVEKSAAIDIENQKLREALRNEELGAVESEKRAREDAAKIVEANAKINELLRERDDILRKNRDLVMENADAKEMIRKQAQQIDDLVHEKPVEPQEPMGDDWGKEMWSPDLGEDEEMTLDILLGQALGTASMCWSPTPTGTYWPEKAGWILNGLKHHLKHNLRQRPSQPTKPVEALVREQDTDAQLWANAFANRFDLPEELDAEITGWFANAIETAKDSVRNRNLVPNPNITAEMHKNPLFNILPNQPQWIGVPTPNGNETPWDYANRLRGHLQATLDELTKQIQPTLDLMKGNGWFDGETAKDEGWSGTYDEAVKAHPELSVTVRQHPDSDFKPLKTAGKDPDAYEFVNAPKHYNDHPSGVECQVIIRECKDPLIAIAFKHLWRTQWGSKPGQTVDQDLGKAIEYIQLEQARRAGKDRL